MKKWLKNNLAVFLIIILLVIIYQPSFVSPFFQDDKLLLEISRSGNILQPAKYFPYRPVSLQTFYFISLKLFGFSVFFYHMMLFIFFSGSLFLIRSIAKDLLKNSRKANLTVFFYALNVSIFPLFYWIATSYYSIGAFFFFLTIYLYLKKSHWVIASLILALGSNEIAFILPFILILTSWYKKYWPKILVLLSVITGVLLVLRIFSVGFPKNSVYTLQMNFQFFSTLRWYVLRAFNLPEGIRGDQSVILFSLFAIFLLLLIISLKKRPSIRLLIYGASFFILGAFPFFFLPNHMSSYYLTISLFGSSLIISELLSKKLMLPAILVYILMAVFGLSFLASTHWIILKDTGPIGKFTHL